MFKLVQRTCLFAASFFLFSSAYATDPAPLPDGKIARFETGDVRSAQYGCPTDRYQHGILGDAIEAGCLIVSGPDWIQIFNLPRTRVFEDITPRLDDLDGDGTAEIITIESDNGQGAALSIFHVEGTAIKRWARTPFIGRTNRWLAPVGIADFDNDGTKDIALVRTPHIGGILEIYRVGDKKLTRFFEQSGFSNHRIGDRRITTSKIADFDKDGVPDIALPDTRWQTIRIMSFAGNKGEIDKRDYKASFFTP